jgi:hypothetical protein
MPAGTKKQQMAVGAALAAERGELCKSSLRGASRQMYKAIGKKELREIATTKRKKLPSKKRPMTIPRQLHSAG